jgi:hypothetical protein
VADLALLISGQRVLVRERHIEAGEAGEAEGFVGDRANARRLECWYFTGRSIRSTSYWYSPNGIMGKDECPFLTKPD